MYNLLTYAHNNSIIVLYTDIHKTKRQEENQNADSSTKESKGKVQ